MGKRGSRWARKTYAQKMESVCDRSMSMLDKMFDSLGVDQEYLEDHPDEAKLFKQMTTLVRDVFEINCAVVAKLEENNRMLHDLVEANRLLTESQK